MPDDHSKVAPLLPIPNRTVKRLCADESADSRVKVGHRQALIPQPPFRTRGGGLCFGALILCLGKPLIRKRVRVCGFSYWLKIQFPRIARA